MPYGSLQDMIDRYGEPELVQLTDRGSPPTGAVDEAVVTGALADASALIDSHLQGRYALPLSPVPALLTAVACDLAREALWKDGAPEAVTHMASARRKLIEAIARGVARLDVAGAEPERAGGAVRISSQDRVFTRESLKGY